MATADLSASKGWRRYSPIADWGIAGREALAGYLFMAPALVGLLGFTALPIIASLILIFLNYDLLTPPTWASGSNFGRLFGDPDC